MARAIRTIGRGVQRKRAPATRLPPVRLLISRCSGDGPANAFLGVTPRFAICLPRGRLPMRPSGYFPGNASPVDSPGNCPANASPGDILGHFPGFRQRSQKISRELSWVSSKVTGKPPWRYFPGNFPWNSPGNVPAAGISRKISREKAAEAKKVGACEVGGKWSFSAILVSQLPPRLDSLPLRPPCRSPDPYPPF